MKKQVKFSERNKKPADCVNLWLLHFACMEILVNATESSLAIPRFTNAVVL